MVLEDYLNAVLRTGIPLYACIDTINKPGPLQQWTLDTKLRQITVGETTISFDVRGVVVKGYANIGFVFATEDYEFRQLVFSRK